MTSPPTSPSTTTKTTTTTTTTTTFQPKAVIFDLLTALLDSWTLWSRAAGSPSLGLTWRKAYLEQTYTCGPYRPYEELVRSSCAAAAAAVAGHIQLDPSAAPRYLLEHWDQLQPWPETLPVLARLREQGGVAIGVVTNCSMALGRSAAAAAAGFGAGFDAVVTAEEVGFYKPDARAYEEVLRRLGIRAEEALFVAGSAADVPGASAVGMKVVWHNRVGLELKGDVRPLREGRTLDETLEPWL